jgi:glycosyltransferase involved in cell wall biosynthesis
MSIDVAIIEPGFHGHRMEFVAYAAKIAQQDGASAILATSAKAAASDEFATEFGHGPGTTTCDAFLAQSPKVWSRLQDLRNLRRRHGSANWVFMNVDEYLLPLALYGLFVRLPTVRGVMLRPPNAASSAKGRVKQAVVRHLLRRGITLLPLTSPLMQHDLVGVLLDPSGMQARPGDAEPDAVWLSELSAWQRAAPGTVVAVIGALTERKNIDALLAAAEQTAGFRLILAGKPDPSYSGSLMELLSGRDALRVRSDLRRLPESEMDKVIETADCVALLYSNEIGSSGILARCVRLGTPVVAYGNATVTSVARLGAGVVANDLLPTTLAEAVDAARDHQLRFSVDELADSVSSSWRLLMAT